MRRDGYNKSLWQDTKTYTPRRSSLSASRYDAVIVGGGMTGVMTAFMLQQAGRSCLIAEAHNLGFGTTGGTTAHLNTLMDTPYTEITRNFGENASRTVARAAANAIKMIEANISAFQIDCAFSRADAYLFSQTEQESNELETIVDAAASAGVLAKNTIELPLPVAFEKAARFDGQAKFEPMSYLYAMAQAFEESGGQIVENCRVTGFDDHGDFVSLHSSEGEIEAAKVVYATHIPPGINILHLRCAPWRSYAIAVRLKDAIYPEGLIYDMKDPYHYYRSQRIGSESYLIAGGKDHKTGEGSNTDHVFSALRAHVQKIFNVQEVTHQWSSQYFESADGLPYIGGLPGASANVYVATGFGGNGMTYSHVAAMEISNLIVKNESLYEELFSPSRVKPVAGFRNFVSHNADVVKHFVGKWFGVERMQELAGLSPGEGRVIRFDDHLVAVSKDDEGEIHAISPVCTHLGCHVAWNATEHSWDCPCHGARYSRTGEVLTGPAVQDLETMGLSKDRTVVSQ